MSGKYEILHPGAFPVVKYHLEMNEKIKAESGAMIAMSPTIDVEGKAEGGLLKGLGRMLAGEKFFFQHLTAKRGAGDVIFGHAAPGGIIDYKVEAGKALTVQKDGFLAATDGVEVETQMQNLTKGLFSGEGFFILNIKGEGVVFLSSYGEIHPITLADGEEIIIDNGHLVAWESSMQYKLEKSSSGWISSLKSGEGVVCRFKGPGKVLIQTRNPGGFVGWCMKLGLGGGK